ncbi:MAG: UDP-N-acetylmuramoyl-L-alanine--D-glutamate ligase, partial [Acidiferrobacteraceae bacterium]|nr:UDP-N-acetylmuramoyl-L-alanine--D-glutamate ligase [Acidiferrobacteraceae bacterium]
METALAIKVNTPPWRRAVVFGLGTSGCSSARYLTELGVVVSVQDTRAAPPSQATLAQACPSVSVHCGGFTLSALENIDLVVVSPGVSLSEPVLQEAARRQLEIVGDIELFARA